MSKARDIADLLDSAGKVTADDLDVGAIGGRRNLIINGGFDIWQRGTGAFTTDVYTSDRWVQEDGGSSTVSTSQSSFTVGQTDVPNNPKYYSTTTTTTGGLTTSLAVLNQRVEGSDTFAGETVTLSFWAKADAAKNIAVEFAQNFGTGGSPSTRVTDIGVTTVSLTTSWAKHTVTVAIPSISGKTLGTNGDDFLQMYFWLDAGSNFNARTNSLGNQSGTFDFAQVQLELGSVATPFEHRSYGEELALCQRYYYKFEHGANTSDYWIDAYSTTNSYTMLANTFPVTMRSTPTSSFGTTWTMFNTTSTTLPGVSLTNNHGWCLIIRATATGRFFAYPNNASYIDFDAEL